MSNISQHSPPLSPARAPVPGTATLSHLSICSCPRGNGSASCAVCLLTWDWPITDHGDDQWQIPRRCNEMYYKVPIIRPVATLTACYYLLCIHQPCIPFIRSIKWGHVNIVKHLSLTHLRRGFDDFFRRSIFDNKWCKENLIEHKNQEPLLTCERFWIKETSWWLLYNLTINWQ